MNTKLSILFYVKRAKSNSNGLSAIYLRVTIDGERIEFSTKRFTHPDKWSVEGNRMKGTSAEARATNTYLDTLKAKVYDYQQELIREGELVNAENMRNKINGVEKRQHTIIPVYRQHNENLKVLIGKEFAQATYVRHETSLKHIEDFLKWKFKVSDLDIKKINHEFITSYEFYLKSVRNCNQNTTMKYIRNFGKIVRLFLANGWIERNPFQRKIY